MGCCIKTVILHYFFSVYSNGDILTITPVSKEILFYPPETEVTVKVGKVKT